jgi:hypothetical protein
MEDLTELRELLNKYTEIYDLLDRRTLEISQKLDKLIVQKMKEGNHDTSRS